MLSTFGQLLSHKMTSLNFRYIVPMILSLCRFLDIHTVATKWAGPPASDAALESLFMNYESFITGH